MARRNAFQSYQDGKLYNGLLARWYSDQALERPPRGQRMENKTEK